MKSNVANLNDKKLPFSPKLKKKTHSLENLSRDLFLHQGSCFLSFPYTRLYTERENQTKRSQSFLSAERPSRQKSGVIQQNNLGWCCRSYLRIKTCPKSILRHVFVLSHVFDTLLSYDISHFSF